MWIVPPLKTYCRGHADLIGACCHLLGFVEARTERPLTEHMLSPVQGSHHDVSMLGDTHHHRYQVNILLRRQVPHVVERWDAIDIGGSCRGLGTARAHRSQLDALGRSKARNVGDGAPTRSRCRRANQTDSHIVCHRLALHRQNCRISIHAGTYIRRSARFGNALRGAVVGGLVHASDAVPRLCQVTWNNLQSPRALTMWRKSTQRSE